MTNGTQAKEIQTPTNPQEESTMLSFVLGGKKNMEKNEEPFW